MLVLWVNDGSADNWRLLCHVATRLEAGELTERGVVSPDEAVARQRDHYAD